MALFQYILECSQVELAEKLCQATGMDKAFFANSGAEANESHQAGPQVLPASGRNRYRIIAQNSFHGRTTGALALTGQTKYQQGFEPYCLGLILLNSTTWLRWKLS